MLRPLLDLIFLFSAVVLNDDLVAGGENITLVNGLVNGLDSCSGRVQIMYNNSWTTVCDDSWDINAAAVVCRELGCGRALTAHTQALFGEGSGPILSGVSCKGNESSYTECLPKLHKSNDCSHSHDAAVVCSASLVVIIGAVIIAVVLLLSATVIIILVMRRKKRKMEEIQKSSGGAVNMLEVPHEDRYEESDDEADYEKVDVEEDHEDLNSDSDQDYVNIDEPEQDHQDSERDDSEQDYVNMESDDFEQDHVNAKSNDSEQDYVNAESDDSEQDYVNVNSTEL